MVLIFIFSFYQFFIKGFNKEIMDTFNSNSISNIAHYLSFGAINSFFANRFFEIDWMLWITFYSIIGILICKKTEKGERKYSQKLIIFLIVFLFFSIYRVPTHPASFEKYINSKEMYQCVTRWECVKISSEISEHDSLRAKAEILSINGYTFDWYVLYAKGYIQLANDKGNIEEINGVNICGFWIEY